MSLHNVLPKNTHTFNIKYHNIYLLLFNLTEIIIKSISITHSLNFHCRITNNKININHSPLQILAVK